MPLEIVQASQTPAPDLHDEILSQLTDQILSEEQVRDIPKDLKDGKEWLEANKWVKNDGIPEQLDKGLINNEKAEELKKLNPSAAKEWLEANKWVKNDGIPEQLDKGWLTSSQAELLDHYGGTYAREILEINAQAHSQLDKGWLNRTQIEALWKNGSGGHGRRWLSANRKVREYIQEDTTLLNEKEKNKLKKMDPYNALRRIQEIEATEADAALEELNS